MTERWRRRGGGARLLNADPGLAAQCGRVAPAVKTVEECHSTVPFCLAILASSAFGGNILGNPGFETGDLPPWSNAMDFCDGCLWSVTGVDAHTGAFSATVSGDRQLEQNFAGIPAASIIEASLWLRMPSTGVAAVFFVYDDSTYAENLVDVGEGWGNFDMTSFLDHAKTLIGFGVWGCSECAGSSITFADDFVVDASPAVPEPSTWLLLGFGGAALGFLKLRKQAV